MNETEATKDGAKMKAKIYVWSAIGHTPITKRSGEYCDELLVDDIDCDNPTEANQVLKKLMLKTKHASRGHFFMPDYWNQNTRSGHVTIAQCWANK